MWVNITFSTPHVAYVINKYYTHKGVPDQMTSHTVKKVKQFLYCWISQSLSFDSVHRTFLERSTLKAITTQASLALGPSLLKIRRGDDIPWETLSSSVVSSPGLTSALLVHLSQTPTPRPHSRPINSQSPKPGPWFQFLKLPR